MTRRFPVRVARRAARQLSEAARWWRQNRPSAPDAIGEEVERVFELLAVQPLIGTRAANAKLAGVRRVHLSRIHYHLYYRVKGSAVEVLAFWHASRGQGPGL